MEEDRKKEIKRLISHYLFSKGISIKKNFSCLNPNHEDHNPSMSFDGKRDKVHCFSCGVDYDVFDLISIDYGLQEQELFDKTADIFGFSKTHKENSKLPIIQTSPKLTLHKKHHEDLDSETLKFYFKACRDRIKETNYPMKRGLTSETVEKYGLGFDPIWKHPKCQENPNIKPCPRLIIPTGEKSYLARDTREGLTAEQKTFSRSKVGPSQIFNSKAILEANRPIFIVEAELDALSVMDVGGESVALGGVSGVKSFLEFLKEAIPKHPLLLLLDNDESGQKAQSSLASELSFMKIPFFEISISDPHKDPNEALVKSRKNFEAFVKNTEKQAVSERNSEKSAYLRSSVHHRLGDFWDRLKDQSQDAFLPTGFDRLDECLGGGLHEGLYLLGAMPGLGKTTFALQMMDQIAANEHDVIIFSLEMSSDELITKSLSRMTAEHQNTHKKNSDHALTARDIKRFAQDRSFKNSSVKSILVNYYEYSRHIFIFEGVASLGVQDIRSTVKNHIAFTGNRPVVLLDYLQVLCPENERSTDKQNTDKAVLELKRISRDFHIPLWAISSFNRAGYGSARMDGFKESGCIEYSADVLIGIQLQGSENFDDIQLKEALRQNPRKIEFVILKNRNGPIGEKLSFQHYAAFNWFRA